MTRRATCLALALLAFLFLLYGSIVPLHLREQTGWTDAIARLGALPFDPTSFPLTGDFFVNVLVFVPIGFFATGAAAPRSRRIPAAAFVSVFTFYAIAAALLEFSQLFVQNRTASWSDVVAMGVGGIAGTLLWIVAGVKAVEWLNSTLTMSRRPRLFRLMGLYSAGWLGVGLLPLLFPKFAYPLVDSIWLRTNHEPQLIETLASVLVTALSAAPVGACLAVIGRRMSHLRAAALLVGGAVTAVLLAAIQQVAPSVPASSGTAAAVGFLLGAWIAWGSPGPSAQIALMRSGRWRAPLIVLWCGLLALHAWAPFDFGVPAASLDLRVRILYERVPLYRYYWAPPLVALNMALTVFLLAVPIGALLRLISWPGAKRLPPVACVLLATTLFALLEWGQLYLPARRADPTDVIIAAVGAFIGVLLAEGAEASPQPPQADS